MFDSPRRRRRRRIVWPLLITLVVAIGVLVVTAGGDTRSTIGYLEDVQVSSMQVSRAGSTLSDLVADLSRVDRAEFQSVVNGVTDALDEAAEVAEREVPDRELLGAMALYRLAVDSWRQGIRGFSDAILRAADEPTDDSVVDDLASAVVSVRAGDDIYGALLDEFAREDVPSPVADMPEIRLLPVDTPITILAPAWVSAAQSDASGLPMRPSVRIEQVRTQPESVQNSEGDLVVPALSETIDVMVVVGNGGNTATEQGLLSLTFTGPEQEPVELEEDVDPIEPGASTSVAFRGLEVTPGSFYELVVQLDPQGRDTHREDNIHSTGFLVNEATPTTDTTSTTATTEGG